MNQNSETQKLLSHIENFRPDKFGRERSLAVYSAALVAADEAVLSSALKLGQEHGISGAEFYEIVLQSYLFLGFPRMLTGSMHLARHIPGETGQGDERVNGANPSDKMRRDGIELCKRVYGGAFERLRDAVEPIAPEVYDWMIREGYGKVLSRPGLDIVVRELSIIAFLTMENRPVQLYSHIRGAFNVGASRELVRTIVDDFKNVAPDGYRSAIEILDRLGNGS